MQERVLDKAKVKRDLVSALSGDEAVEKVVIFGSFVTSDVPHDLDIAIFCTSTADYLTLAMAYRRKLREIARDIPIDLLPITSSHDPESCFLQEINKGETIYEKRH